MTQERVLVVDCKTGQQKIEIRELTLVKGVVPVDRDFLKEIDDLKVKVAALESI